MRFMVSRYQNIASTFQLFAPLLKIARHSIQRMGSFINTNTGIDGRKNSTPLNTVYVRNQTGFPQIPFHDAHLLLCDGVTHLIQEGVWSKRPTTPDGIVVVELN